jgi:hypothetical protein
MTFNIGRSVLSKPVKQTEPALPSVPRMAQNAAKAAGRVIKAAATGKQLWMTPAQREENQAICRSNQCGFFRPSDQRCAHPNCGCFTKIKTRMATEDCPQGLFKSAA